jgi:hypothetical protein
METLKGDAPLLISIINPRKFERGMPGEGIRHAPGFEQPFGEQRGDTPRMKSSHPALPGGRVLAQQAIPAYSIVVLLRYHLQHSFSLASSASLHPPLAALSFGTLHNSPVAML